MIYKSPLDKANEQIAASPTGARGAIDLAGVGRALDRGVQRTNVIESNRATAMSSLRTQQAQPTQATSKIFFNPKSKQYFVGGKAVPARYDTLEYLSSASDLPDQSEAPAGFVPLSQGALKIYVDQIRSEMEGTAPTQFWNALKTGVGDVVAGIPRFLGYDVKNNFADSREESYKAMSLREQAGADEGAFDSVTGFTNSMASGLGSAAPAITAGVAASAATLNPVVGLGVASSVGFSQASGADSEQSQEAIGRTMAAMTDADRRKASPAYAALRDHGVPEEIAIDQVAFDASRLAGLVGGLTTIPETIIGGKFLGNFFRNAGVGKALGLSAITGDAAISKIPKALRFLARTSAAGVGEGVQEVVENASSMAAGNYAAGVGSTDPRDFVRKEDFQGGFTAGIVFGALGGRGQRNTPGDLELGLAGIEGVESQELPAPPTTAGMGMPPDQPLERQLELVGNVMAERFGANWQDNIDHIAQIPEGRQLVGQLSGILREIQARDGGGAAEENANLFRRNEVPGRVSPGTPGPLSGPSFGEPDPNAPPAQRDPRAQPPGPIEQRQSMALSALVDITGATSMEELQAAVPQLQAMAEQEPALQQMLVDAQLIGMPMGMDPQAGPSLPAPGVPQGPQDASGAIAAEPGATVAPNLSERRAYQQAQAQERAAASEQNPAALPSSGVAEIEAEITQLQQAIESRPPRDPRVKFLKQALADAEARWQEAKEAAGPQGVMSYARVAAPEPAEAPAARTADGRPEGVAPAPLVNPEPMSPGEAASRQETQKKRRAKNGKPIAEAAPAPAPLPVVPSTPEPAADIEAQVDAMMDPGSARDSVFVADGNEDAIPAEIPKGAKIYSRKGIGSLITTSATKGRLFKMKAQITDADIARMIGITKDKAAVVADAKAEGAAPIAVQAKTKSGAVAAEALTTPGKKGEAIKAVSKQAGKGAKVTVTTPEVVQAERAAQPKAPVKLGKKGEAVRAASKAREAKTKEARTPKSKRTAKAKADEERTVVEGVAYPPPPRRKRIDPNTTSPLQPGEVMKRPRDGKPIMAPTSLITETGSNDGPVNLLVQSIDSALRKQWRGLRVLAESSGATAQAKAMIDSVLQAFTRIQLVMEADVEAAEKDLIARYEADPQLKEKYEVELANAAKEAEIEGRPRPSVIYALPLLDVEMRQFVDLMVEQAKHELGSPIANPEKSIAWQMLQQIIPQYRDRVGAMANAKQIRVAVETIAQLDAGAKARLLQSGALNLQHQTLAKQVIRGATEVAYVAARGEARIGDVEVDGDALALDVTRLSHVNTYGEIPAAAGKLINGWAKLFEKKTSMGLPKDFRVMSIAAAMRSFPNVPGIRAGMMGAYFTQMIDGQKVHVMAVNWNAAPEPVVIEALAHEFGHFVSEHVYDKSDTRTRAAVKLAYEKWLEANGSASPEAVILSRMPPAMAKEFAGQMDHNSPEYARSFHEWSADNVARWLMTKQEPKTLVEKFFAKAAAILREIYESVIGKGAPDPVWASVLDTFTAQARARATIDADLEVDPVESMMDQTEELPESFRERQTVKNNAREAVRALDVLQPLSDAMKGALQSVKAKGAQQTFSHSIFGDAARRYGLQLLTTHQIADKYKNTPIGKPLSALVTIRDRIDAQAKKLQAKGADALSKAQNLSAATQAQLQELMYFATYYNMNPEVAIDDKANEHIMENADPQVQAEQGRRYMKVRALYDAMVKGDARSAAVYTELRDAFEVMRRQTIETKVENLKKSGMSVAALEVLEEKLNALLKQRREGPYFPLMRVGSWIVKATLPADAFGDGGLLNDGGVEFKTKSAANREANNLKAMYPGAKVQVESDGDGHIVRVYRYGVYFFNSEAEARAAAPSIEKEIRDEYRVRGADFDKTMEALSSLDEDGKSQDIVSQPFQKLDFYNEQKEVSDEFLQELRQLMKDEKVSQQFGQSVEEMYLEALPEYSYRKSLLRRDNILGASKDMLFSYAHRYAGAAHNLATIENSKVLNEAWTSLIALRDQYAPAAAVANTIRLNDELVKDRTSGTAFNRTLNYISDINSAYSLALAPAYVITNAMQVGMISMPYLASMTAADGKSVGWIRSAKYIKEAYAGAATYFTKRGMQDFMSETRRVFGLTSDDVGAIDHANDMIKRFAKTPDEEAMLHDLLDRGRLDFSFLNSLQDAMRGGKVGQKFGALMRLGMAFPQQVEAMNRVVTALAAYRLAVNEMGMDPNVQTNVVDGKRIALGDVISFVDTVVRKTQLDYSRKNRPAFFNRPIAGMVLQFRLYMQGMYMLFIENGVKALRGASIEERREGRRMLVNLMTTHAAVGGAVGIAPIVWMAKMAAAPLVFAFGDDDDKDKWKSTDDIIRAQAVDWFGKEGGNAVMNGLPTLLGLDVSDRLGLPSVIDTKYTGITDKDSPQNAFDKTFLYLLGSPYSNARRMWGATAALADGNLDEAKKGAPAGLRAALRAVTFANEGILDKDGDVFVKKADLDFKDLAIAGLGFQSADVAGAYRDRTARYGIKGRIAGDRQSLMQEWRNASPAERSTLRAEIAAFNKAAPAPFRISPEQLQKSVMAKRDRDAGKENNQDAAVRDLYE